MVVDNKSAISDCLSLFSFFSGYNYYFWVLITNVHEGLLNSLHFNRVQAIEQSLIYEIINTDESVVFRCNEVILV